MEKVKVFELLVSIKNFVDDLWDWAEENTSFMPGLSVGDNADDDTIYVTLVTNRPGKSINWDEVNEFMKKYDFTEWADEEEDRISFALQEVPLYFTQSSVSLIDYATGDGFVLNPRAMAELERGKPEIFEFLRDNADYKLWLDTDGNVVIG